MVRRRCGEQEILVHGKVERDPSLTSCTLPHSTMSSHALSQRANWQAGANQGGAAHERSVMEIFTAYFNTEEGINYTYEPHPQLLDQLFLEVDYKKCPAKYAKPAEPKAGDFWYDETKKTFLKFNGKSWTPARLGMIPDGLIRNKLTGKGHLLEEKKQNDMGNAHERAYRYDTEKIRKILQEKLETTGQPVSWIFTGSMTESQKYILEIAAHLPDDHYVLLKSTDTKEEVLISWFNRVIKPLLE